MDLRQLHTFRLLAQTLSFSQTAVSLNYAQSTVSSQIQALEKELGVSLFDRLGKQVTLTDAGQRLLDYAERLLDLAGEAKDVVSDKEAPAGALSITAPETLCAYRIPKVLHTFRQRYPEVQLIFRPRPELSLTRPLREGYMDLAFIIDQPFHAAELCVEPLLHETILLVAHPEHPLLTETAVQPSQLQNEPMLLTEPTCGYRAMFEKAMSTAGVRLSTAMEFHSVEAIKQCAMAGLGVAFLPEVVIAQELADGRLLPLNWTGDSFQLLTQIAWHRDKWLSPALRAFLSVVREVMRESVAE